MTKPGQPAKRSELTLIVPTEAFDTALPSDDEVEGDEFQPQSVAGFMRRLMGKAEKVDLAEVRAQLEDVQKEVDQLLSGIYESTIGAMHLAQVQVSLTVTAEGSIGIATVGAQASIALVYERIGV
jgi:hypothetical protein